MGRKVERLAKATGSLSLAQAKAQLGSKRWNAGSMVLALGMLGGEKRVVARNAEKIWTSALPLASNLHWLRPLALECKITANSAQPGTGLLVIRIFVQTFRSQVMHAASLCECTASY